MTSRFERRWRERLEGQRRSWRRKWPLGMLLGKEGNTEKHKQQLVSRSQTADKCGKLKQSMRNRRLQHYLGNYNNQVVVQLRQLQGATTTLRRYSHQSPWPRNRKPP
mmetsp:Transcript_28170/g.71464  ORF Transcript_28170/g.71464 Transcript_28170/m.71464 type:complete len:107 (+) Transcript_28170:337-657(+)